MVRVSNSLITILNCVTLILAIAIIGGSLWANHHGATETNCQQFMAKPIRVLGIVLLITSIMGMAGACCRISILLWLYLFLLLVIIVGLFGVTLFTIAVTNQGVGKVVSGVGFKEYHIGDYSHWLQKYVRNEKHWEEIRNCLMGTKICSTIANGRNYNSSDLSTLHLSPIQSGCCKPPMYCGLVYKNMTFWEIPKRGPKVGDSDCRTWSNDQIELCYACKSCKGGFLANVKVEWRKLVWFIAVLIGLLSIIYSVGCCALRNNKYDSEYKRHRNSTP